MKINDEILMALADGELGADEAAALRRQIAADPILRAEYELFEQSALMLRQLRSQDPVPDRLIYLIQTAQDPRRAGRQSGTLGKILPSKPNTAAKEDCSAAKQPGLSTVVSGLDHASARYSPGSTNGGVVAFLPRRTGPGRFRQALWGAGLAASLLLAFAAGMLMPTGQNAGSLAQDFAVDLLTGESRSLANGAELRVLATYETEQGLCRTLSRDSQSQLVREVVCLTGDGNWAKALTLSAPSAGGFIPASDALSSNLDNYLDVIGASDALSPEAERTALGSVR